MIGLGQGFRGSRLHPRPWTAFGMRICEKSVSFVRANRKFEAKLAIIWENGHCKRWLRIFNAFFVLNPEHWTLNLWTVIPPPRRNLIPTSRNSCLFDPPKRKADHFTMPTIRNQMKSVNFSTLLCNLYTGWAVQFALASLRAVCSICSTNRKLARITLPAYASESATYKIILRPVSGSQIWI
jgi:hypothetical protein